MNNKIFAILGIIFVVFGIIALIITFDYVAFAVILGGLVLITMSMPFKFKIK